MAGLGVDGIDTTFAGLEYRVDNIPVFKVVWLKGGGDGKSTACGVAPSDDAVVAGLVGAVEMELFADDPESEDPELDKLEDDPFDMGKRSLWLVGGWG